MRRTARVWLRRAARGAALLLLPPVAAAAGEREAGAASADEVCFEAATDGQRARNEGRLLEARDAFIACAAPSCDAKVVARCVGWLADVEAATPSIVIRARGPRGDLAEGDLAVDGQPVERFAPGKAVDLDPGPHELRLSARGQAVVQKIVLHEREKGRVVDFVFPDAPSPTDPPPARARPTTIAPWVVGGLALASAGVAIYLGADGLDDRSTFGCATGCSQREADAVARKFLVADILGLTAIAAGGVAAWLALASPGASADQRAARRASSRLK